MPIEAAPVHTPADPCYRCGGNSFHTVFQTLADTPSHIGPRGVRYMGSLARFLKCLTCGGMDCYETVRSAPVRAVRPIRPEVVASLRMRVRVH